MSGWASVRSPNPRAGTLNPTAKLLSQILGGTVCSHIYGGTSAAQQGDVDADHEHGMDAACEPKGLL